ncbi:DUF4198 domain-containing protein [Sulfitobacter sp. M57]|uniref:DUF4198 domain-containing protein n=1 Tax=unclassified Sulfitobacter TaxID=196795 RepID=UPI0023E296B4|nr:MULTISPECIES: DUF4198 domain-containing protein [unclassified Sulfitobacter]MDF3413784.1 DUF4198 domain-containing protein [Sulfitobacter sp. KE5]MDF3420935.1 DUF4198 domain-containing protein [Sulfitobacter sp. KE43]MDF3432330.1 DUF4198 domain-containing protein [Sulfitobacter sp. KE42]MDF3457969.1 DUF4198 domain-containing protein [Sulfitobacter sp. S74]MDF3461870.1 DUF4198 domain-containing protein [Sulfitobacter sp. Ks18]
MSLSRLCAALFCALPFSATAHEFWIEPLSYQVEASDRVQALFKNGEGFKGNSQSFFDRRSKRFDVIVDGKALPVTPRSGDSPALDIMPPIQDGLITVVHETAPSTLTYREWAKFLKFAAHKDFRTAAQDHLAAGWSQVKFREVYTRHVKALIAVGTGTGRDSAAGMKTEFVALDNPYGEEFDNQMNILLLLDGEPRADAQIEVFDRAPDQNVSISLFRTNARGQAAIPVSPGHSYLFDAVVLRPAAEANTQENAVVWKTYWAALTFAVPQKPF